MTDFFFRPVMHVQSVSIKADKTGILSCKSTYHTNVKNSYQVWRHGDPATTKHAIYLGVVFTDIDYPNQWMAIDRNGLFWSGFRTTRVGATTYLDERAERETN